MGKSIRLSYCVLFVVSVLWKTAVADKCSLACKGSPTSPTFLNGHKYNYGVEGTVSIFLTGAEKQETSVKLLGQVSVAALGNCVNELVVQNLVISGPDGKKYSSPPGVDKPVRFTLQDGRVGSEICTEDGDTRRSLNIKRAIISLLQSENKPSTQVDVFGSCPTEVSSSKEGNAFLVHRTRDLSRCAYREQGKNDIVSGIFNPTAEIKNSQVLQSNLNVESKVNSGVPEKVSATEEYLYKPFSVGENGARAKVHTKLTLTGKTGGAAGSGNCNMQRSIIFENPHGHVTGSNFDAAIAAVRDTAKTLASEANSKSAGEFAQLVRILRGSSKDDLTKIYGQVKGKNLERRVFLDGLVRAGTGSSVEVIVDLIKSRGLNGFETQIALLSLGNAKHTSDEAVKAAANILDLPNLNNEVYLGVGALTGVYCRDHDCHNVKSDGVAAVSSKFATKLQNCKPKNKQEEDRVVAVLKGIRNIRHLEDSLVDKIIRCASDNNGKARVRVAAIEAIGADPCATKAHKAAMDLMKNRQLDSEIRIKAYLAVIECPCAHSANEIKTLLETEPVHQVGRFITSSLRHIRSSANPDRAHQQHHYSQIRTPNKFNVDDRKYSFFRELSYNVDALGVGGNLEQTVIYSQDSFLPRSASMNLTAELFGHSLNVLEVGGRQGNLDRVVEHFLGPKSFLRELKPQEIYDTIVKNFQETEKTVQDKLSRGRRSVKTEVDNFDKHLKAETISYNNELDLDIYLKLFGTDAIFLSLGDDKGFDFNRAISGLLSAINGGIDQAKHFQQELRAHLLFLDAELAYPTSTGFPLKLDLIGAATGRLELGTNIDLRQIYRNPKNAKIDVKLVPSTDIEIAGLFLVDADAVATGLKVVTNLHSSTGGHLIAKVLEDGRGIDLQFGLPIEKQEIITASNDLIFVTREKGRKEKETALKVDTQTKEYTGCFDQVSGLIGLTLCGEVVVPFSVSGPDAQASVAKYLARYPLTGQSKVKLVLEKNDLRGYHIKAVLRTDNPAKQSFEVLFEAEGTKSNRRTSLSGEYITTPDERTLKLSLEAPIKTIYGQVSYITKNTERVLLAKAKIDAAEYYGKIGFLVNGNEQRYVFKPIIEYQVPDEQGKKNLKVDGQLIREKTNLGAKYIIEGLKITLPNSNEFVDIHGHLLYEPKNYELDLKAKKGDHNLQLNGNLKNYDVRVEFKNTLNPIINFKVNGHIENTNENYHNDIELAYSNNFEDPQRRVIFNQLLKYHRAPNAQDVAVITKNRFEIRYLPIKIKVDADIDSKKVDIELEGQYQDKSAEFDLEARTQIKKPGDYSVKVKGEYNKQGIEAFAKRDIESADKSNLENYVVIKGVGKYELSGVVLHKTKANDMNVGAVGHFKISGGGKTEDIAFDIGAIENAKLYSSHAKISTTKGEILDFLLKLNRGANPSGQIKLNVRDIFNTNGQFQVTDKDGKGNGVIIVDFKKSQRKIKGDVKFVVKDPVYNADVDLFLNFEKDNNDKVHISTNTKNTDKLIDSKNKFNYRDQKFEVNVHRDGEITGKGNSHANVEVVLPNERCFNLKINKNVDIKNDVVNGQAECSLSDAPKRGGPASTITFKGKVTNTNYDKQELNLEGQIELKLKDGKNLVNNWYLKNQPEGEGKSQYEYKTEVKGNLIPQPASLSVSRNRDRTGPSSDEKIRVKGNYGNDMSFEYTGSAIIKEHNNDVSKYQQDSNLNIRLPFEQAHDIRLASNVVFLFPANENVFIEYTIIEQAQVNADVYKFDSSGKLGLQKGFEKVKVLVPHQEPLVLEVHYNVDTDNEKKKLSVDLKSQYGKGKTANIALGAQVASQEFDIQINANAPQAEKLKKLALQIVGKTPAADTYSTTVSADVDGNVYNYDQLIVYSKSHPVIDIKSKCPNSKPSRIYLKADTLSSNHGKFETKVENVRDISIDANGEANIQKDNVAFKLFLNSDKLGVKNYKIDITSKDADNGKRLEFHATNDGKNMLSGSTSFISKHEGPKTIIEGSGSVKVKNEQKSANFKYISTQLTDGNEQGIEEFVNLAIGGSSYVAERRITNLEYKTSYAYCEEKKQCASAELQSKINVPKPGSTDPLQHLLNVVFDLRKLGVAPEFGLQIINEVSEKRLPQYSLDLHINKDDKKYSLHAYSHPEYGKFPAGITVTLPQRVLALESLVTYPTNKALPFPIKGEVALHLDKNKPQTKTAARFMVDFADNKQQRNAVAEIGFSHPKLGREALLKFRGNLAQTNENTFKVEYFAVASHPTLGKDREAKLFLEVNPVHIKLLIENPFLKVIDLEGSVVVKDNLQQGDLKFALLESKPVTVHTIVKDFTYYEFTVDEHDHKLSVIGHLQPEQRVDISADIFVKNEKKNIAFGALYLKDNLVKSDYGLSKDNLKYFTTALQSELSSLKQHVEQLGEKASQDVKSTLKQVEPKFKELQKAYVEEIEKVYKELANDKVLKEISEGLYQIVTYFAKFIDSIMQVTKPVIDQIVNTVQETAKKGLELFEKQVEPQLKQLYANIAAVLQEYFEGLLDIVAHFAALVQDFFDKHKPELQELTNTFAEIFKDLTRLLVAQLKEFRAKVGQIAPEIIQQIKELPIINLIKEKYQELAIPEQALGLLEEGHNTVRELLPTEETKKFADAFVNYVLKKLRQEKVDDSAELRRVYEKFTVALTSLVNHVRQQLGGVAGPAFLNINTLPLFSGPGQVSAPSFAGGVSFSLLNQFLKGDVPDPLSLLRAYRPRRLNPFDEIPAVLRAVVVNGQHIFTFDGRHLTFPGSCRYVLAHDFVDRNFTLALQLANGAPKSLILQDKSGTTLELKDNGQVAVNGASHGYPAIEKDVFAFRETGGRVGLGSRYGLMVFCRNKLEVCYIEASGFYLGKLRGLLGDGNNEPYDDFRMPNGKIATSEAEFGHSFRLASSCAQPKTPAHAHAHGALPAACEEVFGKASPLRPLALVLDAEPFKQACSHAVAGDSANALRQACDIGSGYAALAVSGLLPAVMPAVCVQCTDADQPKKVGESYELKVPNKQADIIVAVETTVPNKKNYKDLVIPLVSQLVDALKSKHITDIKVYLVGITSKFPYPIVYDTDIKLKNPKVNFDDESRYNHIPTVTTGFEKFDATEKYIIETINDLRITFGLTNMVAGYRSLMDLPLRPDAVQHTINVVGEQCKRACSIVEIVRTLVYAATFSTMPYSHTLVTVSPITKIGGGKSPAQVVGYTDDSVLLLGDKVASKGSDNLRDSLEKDEQDPCINFIEGTDGLVLAGANYHTLNPGQQKQFLQTAVSTITNKMLGSNLTRKCVCGYVDPFRVRSICVNEDKAAAGRRK